MKKGNPVKETKGTGTIDTFTYTSAGNLIAWLVKSVDPKQIPNASDKIYDLLADEFRLREDSSSVTIFKFLKSCKDKEIFDKLVEYFRYLIDIDNSNIKGMADLLMLVFESSFSGCEVQMDLVGIWYETIQHLDPEIQKLMLYRTKVSQERRFELNRISVSKEYEEFRFELRSDYERIAVQGYCENCKSMQNVALHYLELIRFSRTDNIDIRVDCRACNTKDILLISNFYS
jgi:YD repeat-containing protein